MINRQINTRVMRAHAGVLSKLTSLPSVKLFLKVLLAETFKKTKLRNSIDKVLHGYCMCISICVNGCVYLKGVEGQGKTEGDSGVPFLEKLFLVSAAPSHLTGNLRNRRESCQLINGRN